MKLSVAIAAYNEEGNLARCLSSVSSWADEIVVVDGGSTDKTVEIALSFHARVIRTDNPPIFHINKQKAIDTCTGDWILQLDADEVVLPELAAEIRKVMTMSGKELENRPFDARKRRFFIRHQRILEKRDGKIGDPRGDIAAFFIPRRNYFLGKPMTYAGTYPDGVIRLIKRGKAWFPQESVHEQIHVEGRVLWLMNDLLHYSNPTFGKYFAGADRYTDLLATRIQGPGIITACTYLFLLPLFTFISLFVRHKGFRDGIRGFLFCFFSSLHYPTAYFKYQHRRSRNVPSGKMRS